MKNIIIAIISLLLMLSSSWAAEESPTNESSLSIKIQGLLDNNQTKEALELYQESLKNYQTIFAEYNKVSADYRANVERHNANKPDMSEESVKAYNEELARLMEQKKQLDAMRASIARLSEELNLASQRLKGR